MNFNSLVLGLGIAQRQFSKIQMTSTQQVMLSFALSFSCVTLQLHSTPLIMTSHSVDSVITLELVALLEWFKSYLTVIFLWNTNLPQGMNLSPSLFTIQKLYIPLVIYLVAIYLQLQSFVHYLRKTNYSLSWQN